MKRTSDFRAAVLPYCLQRQPDGTHIALNRFYKPVGVLTYTHLEYESYPIKLDLGLPQQLIDKLGGYRGNDLYLYNDATVPTHSKMNMSRYMDLLAQLSRLQARAGSDL